MQAAARAWLAERYDREKELGTVFLNGAFQQFGVAGVGLSLAGPDGVEWAAHRGLWAIDGEGSVAPTDALSVAGPEAAGGRVGWGQVTLTVPPDAAAADEPPDAPPEAPPALAPAPRWAIEWRREVSRREATATLRLLVLADGAPDAAFVRHAVGAPATTPVTIPVQIP